jgi:hypothetical protein
MKTRTLVVIVAVVVVLAVGAVVVLGDGEGVVVTWLRGLHGAPAGRH